MTPQEDIHVKAGDDWPPPHLADESGPLDLTSAATVRRSIDGGPLHDAEVIDAAQGVVALPRLEVGEHTVVYEIDWGDAGIETIPNGPQRIIAH